MGIGVSPQQITWQTAAASINKVKGDNDRVKEAQPDELCQFTAGKVWAAAVKQAIKRQGQQKQGGRIGAAHPPARSKSGAKESVKGGTRSGQPARKRGGITMKSDRSAERRCNVS